ncbi:MAG: DUF1998 domain-containing protein [Eubacteriales bacterium]|nr:DUF1998 domain-containing protein [Eubacteriales bacterium]
MAIISKKPMRRSSLISPWGVGAIVPFPNDESLMIAGLDMWQYTTTEPFLIKDERLQKRLGVKELRWPPDFRDRDSDAVNFNLKIPAVRFPRWHYCPFCGTMQKVGYFTKQPTCDAYQWPHGRKCNPNARYKHRLIPERFVVVCPDGHIDDFPIAEWVHFDSGHKYDPETCKIRRSTGGTSAALTGVRYECSCGASKSIAAALRPGALKRIGYTCKATKPWLGIEEDTEHPCTCDDTEKIKVLQRGASNVWFADTRSSIYIPTDDEVASRRIVGIVNSSLNYVMNQRLNGQLPRDIINMLAGLHQVNADELYQAFERKINNLEGLPEVTESMTEDEYRIAEYRVLTKNSGSDAIDFHSINHPISAYHKKLGKYFKSISLVNKLRETRAFVGFSRLEPNTSNDIAKSKSMLRLGNGDWLPAVEVYGEGIFFEFNPDTLSEWATREDVVERISLLNSAYSNSYISKASPGDLRPEFILIHTFAHLLINQLSYECGYGSSSIRERIYCEKTTNNSDMCGVLIYTASGDSEGSLGGLVRQGEPGRLEDTVLAAIHNAEWCSSDPICIQSYGQGPESCNLAACHNCALLPETCCECGNRLLDRGVVVGTLDNLELGYFDQLRNK